MPEIIDLRPDKSLLNANFEKYQFSSELLNVIYETSLEKDVFRQEATSKQDSLLEARLFAFHNHLYRDPFSRSCWFITNDGRLWELNQNNDLKPVHTLSLDTSSSESTYNPSIAFASSEVIVLSNGRGKLELLIKENEEIKNVVLREQEIGVLLDAKYREDDFTLVIALNSIQEQEGKKISFLSLLCYSIKTDCADLIRKQVITINGAIEYVYLEKSGSSLNLVAQDNAIFTHDSTQPLKTEVTEEKNSEIKIPKYCWSQDEDSLTVYMKIPEKFKHIKAKVLATSTNIAATIEDIVLINGDCQFRIDHELTTWKQENDSLSINFVKFESGQMWSELLKGDTGGEYLPNADLASEIHSRLAHLCSDAKSGDSQPALGFNAEQLEECDIQDRDNLLQRIDLEKRCCTHMAMLMTSNRVLFAQKLKAGMALCLRYENDGCVWQIDESNEQSWSPEHVNTFPGFGYVEASKGNRKFCVSPPGGSYVAIVEHTRCALIYTRPNENATVSKQFIVELGPESTPTMGAVATNQFLILLTQNKLYRLKIVN